MKTLVTGKPFSLPSRNVLIQRKCACGGKAGSTGECEQCKRNRLRLQPKLAINQPGDRYEKEADELAEAVTHGARVNRPVLSSLGQQDASLSDAVIPTEVHEVVNGSGQALDARTRASMEGHFGYDFGRVRVHAHAQAAASARAVNAQAYTVNENIVFDSSRYAPETAAGKRLLAHELAHVVQQGRTTTPMVQRQEKPTEDRVDVALVFGDEATAMDEAKGYASTAIRVISCEDAKKKLLALNKPLGRVYMVSHGNKEGKIIIDSPGGRIEKSLSDCGNELKGLPGDIAPSDVDFRGCQLGQAPKELESFRQSVGAKTARSGNCWTRVKTMAPFMYGGVPLTKESQVQPGDDAAINAALKTQLNNLKTEDGHPVKNCVEGLTRGESADGNLSKLRKLYFERSGHLTAAWVSPEYNDKWQSGSICIKDLTRDTKPCSSVVAEAPKTAPAAPPAKKQGAMTESANEQRTAGEPAITEELTRV
jgi:hypothetical protein